MKILIADCESTGLADDSQIIEAAWIEAPSTVVEFMSIKKYSALPYYHQFFEPQSSISFGAMATHNIIPEDLEGMARSELFEFPDDVDYLIGHNIDYDWNMFGGPDVKRICTLALSRWMFPDVDSHKQSAMLYYIGSLIGDYAWARDLVKSAHSAIADVNVCAILLRFLVAELRKRNIDVDTWDQLWQISETARIPTVISFGKHKGARIEDVPSDYVRWYRGTEDKDPYLLEAFKRAGK